VYLPAGRDPRALRRVVAIEALEPFRAWLRFDDHSEGIVDLADLFAAGGVFTPMHDPAEFARVRVESEFGAIVWPGDVELDPEALHARLIGASVA